MVKYIIFRIRAGCLHQQTGAVADIFNFAFVENAGLYQCITDEYRHPPVTLAVVGVTVLLRLFPKTFDRPEQFTLYRRGGTRRRYEVAP
jgi:hypothetical protein